jgi:hypothetical protein
MAALALALGGCSDPVTLSIEVTPGHETDAFEQDPAVTQVSITAIDVSGGELLKATTSPGGGFTLGELPTDQLVHFEVRGTDANGDLQMRGRSLGVVLGALETEVFPVFTQRVNAWARPPGELPQSRVDGVAAALGERYLVLTGGTATDGDPKTVLFYDMLSLGGVVGGTLSLVPKSLAVSANGRALILIDDERALWLDFDDGTSIDLTAPEGLGPYANVAGGIAVRSPEATFIVGATRSGEPTDRILIIDNAGTLTSARLNAPRSEAAASWVEGVGLVVVGGSADGAGAEVIADGKTDADDLPYEADPVAGAVAALGPSGEQVLLVCGSDVNGPAPIRLVDLDCGATCAATMLSTTIGPLTGCSAHRSGDLVLVTGHNDNGIMESYAVDPIEDSAIALPLREERMGARVIAAPNGTLAIIGGEHADGSPALTVELLFPSE